MGLKENDLSPAAAGQQLLSSPPPIHPLHTLFRFFQRAQAVNVFIKPHLRHLPDVQPDI